MTGNDARSAYMAAAAQAAGIEPQLLPEGGRPLSQLVMHAHYQGDLDEIHRLCLRAEAGLAPVGLTHLSDGQLEERIGRIHVLLAAANDELQRRGRTRAQRLSDRAREDAAAQNAAHAGRPLDPSDA